MKYALPTFIAGGMYQLPHRSLATAGKPYAPTTVQTNSASSLIERSRLLILSVERLRSDNVDEKLVESRGKMISEVLMGSDMPCKIRVRQIRNL